jgi:SMODS domain-containing protein
MTAAAAFERFLAETVRFRGTERQQASTSQTYLRDQLAAYALRDPGFPNLIDGDFLSGSFGRRTGITPLDDIDVMMILDGTGLVVVRNGSVTGDTVEGSGNLAKQIDFGRFQGPDAYLSSHKILSAFRSALRGTIYPNSEVGNAEQAVNVWLSTYGIGMDIVPAFHIVPLWGQDYYMIPEGHGSHGWLNTNPKLDASRIATVGGASVGLLRDVIRLMRYWNQERNGERLSGYHVEVLTLLSVESRGLVDVAGTVAYVFNDLITRLAWVCPSQTGFGGNVDAELTDLNRQQSIDAARTAAFAAYGAISAESTGDHALALALWSQVFGPAFPTT